MVVMATAAAELPRVSRAGTFAGVTTALVSGAVQELEEAVS
jgi:hypothetical protein